MAHKEQPVCSGLLDFHVPRSLLPERKSLHIGWTVLFEFPYLVEINGKGTGKSLYTSWFGIWTWPCTIYTDSFELPTTGVSIQRTGGGEVGIHG